MDQFQYRLMDSILNDPSSKPSQQQLETYSEYLYNSTVINNKLIHKLFQKITSSGFVYLYYMTAIVAVVNSCTSLKDLE